VKWRCNAAAIQAVAEQPRPRPHQPTHEPIPTRPTKPVHEPGSQIKTGIGGGGTDPQLTTAQSRMPMIARLPRQWNRAGLPPPKPACRGREQFKFGPSATQAGGTEHPRPNEINRGGWQSGARDQSHSRPNAHDRRGCIPAQPGILGREQLKFGPTVARAVGSAGFRRDHWNRRGGGGKTGAGGREQIKFRVSRPRAGGAGGFRRDEWNRCGAAAKPTPGARMQFSFGKSAGRAGKQVDFGG